MSSFSRKHVVLGLVVAAVVVGVVLAGGRVLVNTAFERDYSSFRSVKVGMAQEQVLQQLGEPYLSYERASAPENYYVSGYSYKRRPISERVLIYVGSEPILYVYVGSDGRVEETFIGGS